VGSKKELAELFKKAFGFGSGEPIPLRISFETEEEDRAQTEENLAETPKL